MNSLSTTLKFLPIFFCILFFTPQANSQCFGSWNAGDTIFVCDNLNANGKYEFCYFGSGIVTDSWVNGVHYTSLSSCPNTEIIGYDISIISWGFLSTCTNLQLNQPWSSTTDTLAPFVLGVTPFATLADSMTANSPSGNPWIYNPIVKSGSIFKEAPITTVSDYSSLYINCVSGPGGVILSTYAASTGGGYNVNFGELPPNQCSEVIKLDTCGDYDTIIVCHMNCVPKADTIYVGVSPNDTSIALCPTADDAFRYDTVIWESCDINMAGSVVLNNSSNCYNYVSSSTTGIYIDTVCILACIDNFCDTTRFIMSVQQCMDTITINTPTVPLGNYTARTNIISNASLNTSSNVELKAGQCIELNNGFEVPLGGELYIGIDSCQ